MKSLLRTYCFFVLFFVYISPVQVFAQEDDSKAFAGLETGRYLFNVLPEITEVSSAVYNHDEGIVWVLGDGDSGAKIARVRLEDNDISLIDIAGVENIDWEALILTADGDLWILDVGDNDAKRDNIKLFRVRPDLIDETRILDVLQIIHVSYPEGPMDVEAAVMRDERIYLFEKISIVEFKKARIVSVDVSGDSEISQTAMAEGRLPVIFSITDASLSPEGVLYLLTYYGIFECYFWQKEYSFSLMSKFFFLGQQESMAVMGSNLFLVGVETGNFYQIKKWFPFLPF